MIYATTPRLTLRALEKDDLPRMTGLINDWDVMKWLVMPPFPYALKDAEDFYEKMLQCRHKGATELFVIAARDSNLLMGVVGLHPDKRFPADPQQAEIGYWLAKDFWGQGYMGEALPATMAYGFRERPHLRYIVSATDPANDASQNVLRKAGFAYLGIHPRPKGNYQRGSVNETRWEISRATFESKRPAA